MGDGTSDAANAGRSTRTEIGRAAASHVATARVRQRGLTSHRVRSESIIKIEAIGRSGRRAKANGASSARAIDTPQTLQIPGADASSRWSRFADATRPVRWRLMSRQGFHSTRACRIRQGRTPRFAAVFALGHALFQLVAACCVVAWHARSLAVAATTKTRTAPHAARVMPSSPTSKSLRARCLWSAAPSSRSRPSRSPSRRR